MRGRLWQSSLMIVLMTTAIACAAYSGTAGLSGPGEFNPINGNYTQLFSASLDRTWEAVLQTVKALQLDTLESSKDRSGGHLVAERANGTDVKLTLTPKGARETEVKIEVGWGDKNSSIRIAQELERRLKR
jgi:hypothetical protein